MRGRWTMSVPMFRARGKGIGFICARSRLDWYLDGCDMGVNCMGVVVLCGW
jgi:hypothetical protein